MRENVSLKCSQNHNQAVCSVIVDKYVKKDNRLLCSECMEGFQQANKIVGLKIMTNLIDKNIKENKEKKNQFLWGKKQQIESLKNYLIDWKSYIIQIIDSIIGDLSIWIQQLTPDQSNNITYSFIDELDMFLNNKNHYEKDFENIVDNIIKLNESLIIKIQGKLKEINNKSRNLVIHLKKTFLDVININQPQINLKLINDELKQSENCWAMAFNHTGQILVSGCGKDIKIWNFEQGQMTEQNELSGHSNVISCLLFSKYQNNFISGAYDNSIICWKLVEEQKWQCSQQYLEHTDRILCLILSKDENTLFSGSNDSTIKVWKVDFSNNNINYCYSLLNHKNRVFGLSLNTSETYLVSCGQDNQIIVWMKVQNNQWVFQQVVNQSITGWGVKVTFIQDNQFIWFTGEQNREDCICFFNLENGIFEEQKYKELQLQQNNQVVDYSMFPIMVNQENGIFLFRHKCHIYLLTKKLNGQYNITTKLQFDDNSIFGTITNDFKFLVLWNESQNNFLVYEMKSMLD